MCRSRNILVVGGAGFIGSHVCKALRKGGFTPVVYDSLEYGHEWAVQWGPLMRGNLLDSSALHHAFETYLPIGVIHLASYINARESNAQKERYYYNNVIGSMKLLEAMRRYQIRKLVFSSTAAVYGHPTQMLLFEHHPCKPINVYGTTKWMVEQMLHRFFEEHQLCSVILRYFNAAGADPDGELGEAHDPETHLIPVTILATLKKRAPLQLFGVEHATTDGTPVRDYVHVTDLAQAHVHALEWLLQGGKQVCVNLGSGSGYSVREVIGQVEKIMKQLVPYQVTQADPSDPPFLVASAEEAQRMLHWKPIYSDLETIVATAVNWYRSTTL